MIGLRLFRATILAMFVVTIAAAVAVPMLAWGIEADNAAGIGLLVVVGGVLAFLFALVDLAIDQGRTRPPD